MFRTLTVSFLGVWPTFPEYRYTRPLSGSSFQTVCWLLDWSLKCWERHPSRWKRVFRPTYAQLRGPTHLDRFWRSESVQNGGSHDHHADLWLVWLGKLGFFGPSFPSTHQVLSWHSSKLRPLENASSIEHRSLRISPTPLHDTQKQCSKSFGKLLKNHHLWIMNNQLPVLKPGTTCPKILHRRRNKYSPLL